MTTEHSVVLEPSAARRRRRPAASATKSADSPKLRWNPVIRFREVRWSVPFVFFLAYIFAIVTFELPIGQAAMIGALLTLPLERKGKWFPAPVLLLGLFLLWSVVGVGSTSFAGPELWDEIEVLAKICLIFLVACRVLTTTDRIQFYIGFYLAFFLLYPIRGAIVNYIAGYAPFNRMLWNYIYENPNDLAGFTLLPLALAGIVRVTARELWVRRLALTAIVVMVAVVLMTQSRGGFIGLCVLGLLSLRAVVTDRRARKRMRSLSGAALLVLVVAGFAPDGFWQRMAGLQHVTEDMAMVDEEGSALQRFMIMKVGLDIASDYPVTGVGLGQYGRAHAYYTQGVPELALAAGERDTHSTYLRLLAETGLPGLLIFFALIGIVMRKSLKAQKILDSDRSVLGPVVRFLRYGLMAFLVTGIVASYGMLSFLYLHLALLWTASEAGMNEARRAERPRVHRRSTPALLGPRWRR